jgi:serine/threonine-protein phosphatase Stp1
LKQLVRNCVSEGRTDRGKVRERNEDAFFNSPELGLWVVADGMGGHQCGDVASQMIVKSIAGLSRQTSFDERLADLRGCLVWANHQLAQGGLVISGTRRSVIGSTVVALLIEGARAACIWAGDSRCYLWRGQRLYQLSKDHTVFRHLVEDELMCARKAAEHPSARALTRAVGGALTLDLDVVELEARCGDVFILCSDGLHQAIEPQLLADTLDIKSPRLIVDLLFDSVLQGAADDNLTAVVVRI